MGHRCSDAEGAGAALFPAAAVTASSVSLAAALAAASTASPRHPSALPASSSTTATAAAVLPRREATTAEGSLSAAASASSTAASAATCLFPAIACLPTAAPAVTSSVSRKAATAAGWRLVAGSRLAAAAALLALCAAAAAAARTDAASSESATASAPASYWAGREPAAGEELFKPSEAHVTADQVPEAAASAEYFSPPAAGASAGPQQSYRRSGAAAYEWFEPSARAAALSESGFRETVEMPVLYSLSFLHDFLNYATALLWFAAYTALLWRVCVARNIHGLSLQSLFALVLVEISNVLLVVCLSLYHGKRLHAEFFLIDVSSAAVSLFTFLYVYRFFGSSYEAERDNFGKQLTSFAALQHYSRKYYFAALYVLSLCLAIPMFLFRRASVPTSPLAAAPPPPPLHADAAAAADASARSASHQAATSQFSPSFPSLLPPSNVFTDAARRVFYLLSFWECFNDTVLALALLPQLCMLYNKRPRKVASLLGTFVVLLFFARVFAFLYWLTFPLFHNAYPAGRGIHLATEALNILLLSDFLYYYLKARLSGETDISLPL